jgi:hypothetical protein
MDDDRRTHAKNRMAMTNQQPPRAPRAAAMDTPTRAMRSTRSTRPRRSRRALLWAALVGLVVALGVVAVLVFTPGTGGASVAAQRFCDALVRRDYTAAYGQLAQNLRGEGTAAQFAASQQDLDRLDGAVSSCRFSAPQVHGSRAMFTLTLTRAQSGTMSGALELVLERGAWLVDAYDANVI